ncbi:metal ABC transporter solute-binding protein, Zn/Mn family [Pseudoglutamicibacter cumminsii]|uniref:metal ABC transporter solute-binding protein, Zn/Mn family n=1 Tax=Pseudoglutamicibacter cumminsii TaxID=156979 RepID=UPI0026EFB64F|nr:zinc ABC transporter substrate-binding protein [Pseudoglutamicibacter cumminsii]
MAFATTSRPRAAKVKGLLGVATALSFGLAVTGCSAAEDGKGKEGSATEQLNIVATTNVYGDIASSVAGEHGKVSSIISNAAQDPHSYEATAKDKLAISKADVVIINGGGYDYFAEQIIEDLGDKAPTVVKSFEGEGHSHDHGHDHGEEGHDHDHDHGEEGHDHDHDHGEEGHDHDHDHGEEGHDHDHGHEGHSHEHGENEHVWYDLDHMEEFVGEVGEALAKADPDNAKTYEENASKLAKEISDVTDSEDFKAAEKMLKGKSFMMTEPVPEALLDELGMEDGTPEGLSSAVEAGQEIPALVIKRAEDSLKQGKVQLFAFNSQTADPQTKKLYESAQKAGVPTVDVTETIPEGKTFVEWMKDNVAAIAKAVDAK